MGAGNRGRRPVSFVYWQAPYRAELGEERWEDHGFPAAGPRRPRLYHCRYRAHYRVRTSCGRRFILGWDRGVKVHPWLLLQEIWLGCAIIPTPVPWRSRHGRGWSGVLTQELPFPARIPSVIGPLMPGGEACG